MHSSLLSSFFLEKKRLREKISCLTAYDYGMARLIDESGIDLILVGDTLGMVVLGYPDTTSVTLLEILHHLRAVRRGVQKALLVADIPAESAISPDKALEAAIKLQEAGADMVKVEGPLGESISKIKDHGIDVIGHIGMLPQKIKEEGRYLKKGKSIKEQERLLKEALQIEQAGAVAIVLEAIIPTLAQQITYQLQIPTIGIGSGAACDGQILVTMDLLGLQPWFCPPFVKPKVTLAKSIQSAIKEYIQEVKG